MTALAEWGMDWSAIRRAWSWEYFKLMQRAHNARVRRLNEEAAGGRGNKKELSDEEFSNLF